MFQFSFLFLRSSFVIVPASLNYAKRNVHKITSPNCHAATSVKGLLLDITGVLYESGTKQAINGSVESIEKKRIIRRFVGKVLEINSDRRAIQFARRRDGTRFKWVEMNDASLRHHKIPFRFVTNESMNTRCALVKKLQSFGFKLSEEEIFSPGIAASLYIQECKLRPYLLVHPDILPEFSNCDQSSPNSVVVGDAAEHFTYENMNKAFTVLMKTENPVLISLGKGRYYRDKDELVMDLGGFTAALEYATGVTAKVIGKPSCDYFYSAAKSLELKPEDIAMVGDDISSDVCASKKCGFKGVLVRTGKFREKDLEASSVKPDAVVDNLAQYVDMLCS